MRSQIPVVLGRFSIAFSRGAIHRDSRLAFRRNFVRFPLSSPSHPFTSPKPEDEHLIDTEPGKVRANAYDLAMNGVELGGGSIRIHDRDLQKLMFQHLGFTEEEAQEQFGFLMNAFEYGAPPHGGLAFGLDRLCSIMGGAESIRDFIAFPKNNSGRDVMIDAPSNIDRTQLDELSLKLVSKKS